MLSSFPRYSRQVSKLVSYAVSSFRTFCPTLEGLTTQIEFSADFDDGNFARRYQATQLPYRQTSDSGCGWKIEQD
jgi:hypothetical protein